MNEDRKAPENHEWPAALSAIERDWSQAGASHLPEPPDLVDKAVLNAARRALDTRPRGWAQRALRGPWPGLVGTAAVVVIAFTLVLQQSPPGPTDMSVRSLPDETTERFLDSDDDGAVPEAAVERRVDVAPRMQLKREAAPPSEPADRDGVAEGTRPEDVSIPIARDRAEADEDSIPPMSPEAWIDAIRQLIADGQIQEAARRLHEFRVAWPDYPLPEDLAGD